MKKSNHRTKPTPPALAESLETAPPIGLQLFFQLIREEGETTIVPAKSAGQTYHRAIRILQVLRSSGDSTEVGEVLSQAADDMFEWDGPARNELNLVQTAAYQVGFAVCWTLMQELAGVAPRELLGAAEILEEDAGAEPHTLDERIPTICRIADVLRICQISQAAFFKRRRAGTFPIPEIEPAIDSSPRFHGKDVKAWIDGSLAARATRASRGSRRGAR